MSSDLRSPAAARLQQVGHILAGLIILLKSSVVAEHHPALGVILIVLGLSFVGTAIFHRQVERKIGIKGERLLFLLEAGALLVIAYEMVAEHKRYLQYAYTLAAFIYVSLAIAFPYLQRRRQRRSVQS